MTTTAHPKHKKIATSGSQGRPGQEVLKELRTNEVFVAVVGPAGAGSGATTDILQGLLKENGYEVEIIKASALIRAAAESAERPDLPTSGHKSIEYVRKMQNLGDELRKGTGYPHEEDHSAVARLALKEIAKRRASLQQQDFSGDPVEPDGNQRAFIIDSLRHPAEVALLREVYQEAFTLVGVVCAPAKREKRILEKTSGWSERSEEKVKQQVQDLLTRDEDAPEKHGQHVSDTFYESDFFVDNSQDTSHGDLQESDMNQQLSRYVRLITQSNKIVRPTISETAMHHAYSAKLRSACLSRQVGATLVDAFGNIIATGTNDVPKAGGGLYGEYFENPQLEESKQNEDHRCAFRDSPYCSNNREQNNIIKELIDKFSDSIDDNKQLEVSKRIRSTRIGGLLEFSRAVHAEMDAILSASISGTSPRGCRMYVTTYPCHYCARHIIAAGIDEVQYIEPYPKSKAAELHSDSITTESDHWDPPSKNGSKVLFRPFVGVAPRLYRSVFLKDRSYKDDNTGAYKFGEPEWGRPTELYKFSYPEMEKELALGVGSG